MTTNGPLMPFFFPIVAGVGLLGPVAAVGFYELARRREDGHHSDWTHFLDVRKRPAPDDMGIVAGLLLVIFALWLIAAGIALCRAVRLGDADVDERIYERRLHDAARLGADRRRPRVGAAFGWIVLGDQHRLAADAGRLRPQRRGSGLGVMARRPRQQGGDGALGPDRAALLVLGSIPLFVGLAVVLPWLGYATWHLYTRLIDRDAILGRRCD